MRSKSKTMLTILVFASYMLIVGAPCPLQSQLQFGNQWKSCISKEDCRNRNFVIFRSTCIHTCPHKTFYEEHSRTCYDKCPNDYITKEDKCLNGTYCLSKSNKVLYNGSCQDSCPDVAPLIHLSTCYASCPVNTVVNKTHCMNKEDCIDKGYFIYNDTCIHECPIFRPFTLYGVCLNSCPTNSFVGNNNLCLSKEECISQHKGVVYNSSCLSSCPKVANFTSLGVCYHKCPTQTVSLGYQCLSTSNCLAEQKFIHKNECVSACPTESPYVVNKHCLSSCPQWKVLHNMKCISVDMCTSSYYLYKVVYNGSCVDKCPLEAPVTDRGSCVKRCPPGTVATDLQCMHTSQCSAANRVIFNQTCVPKCPNIAPYSFNSHCYKMCPQGLYQMHNETRCVTETVCQRQGRFIANLTCVKQCPHFLPYHLDIAYGTGGTCYSKCPRIYISMNLKCVYKHECHSVLYAGHCVPSCPEHAPFRDRKECRETCSADKLIFNRYQCLFIKECVSKHMFVYNGECVLKCPPEAVLREFLCIKRKGIKGLCIQLILLILVSILFLLPCIYNPKRSRLLNAPKIWKELRDEDVDGQYQCNDSFVLNEAALGLLTDENDPAGSLEPGSGFPEVSLPSEQDGVAFADQPQHVSVVVHECAGSEDELLSLSSQPQHYNDDDDAWLFGDGDILLKKL